MTNLALYYKFVDAVRKYYSTNKRGAGPKHCTDIIQTEDCFLFKVTLTESKGFDAFSEFIKSRGWKPFTDEETSYVKTEIFEVPAETPDFLYASPSDFMSIKSSPFKLSHVYRRYLCLVYNKKQDKMAICYKDVGFGWADSKNRYYPLNSSDPILTKTDKFWVFKKPHKKKLQVREFKINDNLSDPIEYAMRSVFNLTELEEKHDIQFYSNDRDEDTPPVLFRNVLSSSDVYEAMEKGLKITFPKALKRRLGFKDLWELGKVIEPADFNKICQVIAAKDKLNTQVGLSVTPVYAFETLIGDIYSNQCEKVLSTWLIRDYINDHSTLKKKMNLKISSAKRINEDHERNSDIIRSNIQGPIKVHKKFNKCFIGFRGEWELITTRARLNQEGLQQKHCVAGYGPQINRGESCIVSLMWEGDRYTVELGCISAKKPTFYIKQLQGYRNSQEKPVPDSLYLAIEEDCNIMTKVRFNSAFHLEPVPEDAELNI